MTPDEIREWRKRLGLTRRAAAEALGVSLSMVSLYEGKWTPGPGRAGEIPKTVRLAMASIEAGVQDPG